MRPIGVSRCELLAAGPTCMSGRLSTAGVSMNPGANVFTRTCGASAFA